MLRSFQFTDEISPSASEVVVFEVAKYWGLLQRIIQVENLPTFLLKSKENEKNPRDPTSIYREKNICVFSYRKPRIFLGGEKKTTTPNCHGIPKLPSPHGIRLDRTPPSTVHLDVLFIQGKHFGFDPDLGAAKRPSGQSLERFHLLGGAWGPQAKRSTLPLGNSGFKITYQQYHVRFNTWETC